MIDYKELLRKYMEHVLREEGITFCDSMSDKWFSEEEKEELRRIDESIQV